MVGTSANILGIFVGYLLPMIFVTKYSEETVLTEANSATYK
jgi:hypothetical protein